MEAEESCPLSMAVAKTQLGAARTSRADGESSEVNFSFRAGALSRESERKGRQLTKCASTVGARLSPALVKCVDFLSRVEGRNDRQELDDREASTAGAEEQRPILMHKLREQKSLGTLCPPEKGLQNVKARRKHVASRAVARPGHC